jgi:hypothetical protein
LSIFHRQQLINISSGAVYQNEGSGENVFRRLTTGVSSSMVFALPPLNPELATNLMDTITDEDILGKLSEMQKMTMLEPEDIGKQFIML